MREFIAAFSRDTLQHFREEEQGAFRLLARYAGAQEPLLVQALDDHVELQVLAARLDQDLESERADPSLMHMVAERLQTHIRLEERELFPLLEQVAPAAELDALARSASA